MVNEFRATNFDVKLISKTSRKRFFKLLMTLLCKLVKYMLPWG